jgi:hypothetical protein
MTFARSFILAAALAVPALAVDPALLRMVPPGARVVAGIDVRAATASPFGQFLLSRAQQEDREFQQFIEASGFDPRRDLTELLFVSIDPAPRGGDGLVLARGRFDADRLTAFVQSKGRATVTTYNGVRYVSLGEGDHGAFALLDASTAIAGKPDAVKAAIDRRNGTAALEHAMSTKVQDLSARYDAWMVASGVFDKRFMPPAADTAPKGPVNPAVLQGIEQTSGGVKFGSTVQVDGEAVARSDKDATALADVVKFMTGMIQLNRERPEVAQFAAALDSLKVTAEGTALKLSISIPEADLEKIMTQPKRAPAKRPAAGRA